MDYVIYTDGSCDPHTGRGGWAYIILKDEGEKTSCVVAQHSGAAEQTTSVRMETQAAIEALKAIREMHGIGCKIEIKSDATYLVSGGTKWLIEWKKEGKLHNLDRPSVTNAKNIDLWRIIDFLVEGHIVTWTWIKGHSTNPFNAECDRMATEARLGLSGIQMSVPPKIKKVDASSPMLEVAIKAVRDEAPWINLTAATRIAKSVLHAVQKRG